MRPAIFTAAIFALLTGSTRLFAQGVQTRTQILAFWVMAGIWEFLVRPCLGHQSSIKTFAITAVAIGAAALGAKWYMELIYIPRVLAKIES